MTGSFFETWQQARDQKNSLLCVGIDPAEAGQRQQSTLAAGQDKRAWCLKIIEQTGPFASAIKINRNYVKDLSRQDLRYLNDAIHAQGAVSIDDSKIADIGSTNHAALFHAKEEGFDAVTFAPFPGNIAETAAYGQELGIGVIMLVLMSNPEFAWIKSASIAGEAFYKKLASAVSEHHIDGLVVGAPSANNHITSDDLTAIKQRIGTRSVVLVPGVGAQGGDAAPILAAFGQQSLINATRSICFAADPAAEAKRIRDELRNLSR